MCCAHATHLAHEVKVQSWDDLLQDAPSLLGIQRGLSGSPSPQLLNLREGEDGACLVNEVQWSLSRKDTLSKGHLSNKDTVYSSNHIEGCTNLPLN